MRWYTAYRELEHFITESRQSKIDNDVITIPEEVRPEFYRRFDAVRTAFIEERLPDLLHESRCLSESYTKVEEEVVNLLRLDYVSMPVGLDRFLHEPKNQLLRGLFDPLFDLLREKTDAEAFAQEASRSIERSFKDLYPLGYEKWVVLSLVRLLEPNKSFHIPLRQPASKEIIKRLPTSKEPVPLPEESDHLSFEHERVPILTVPDFVVYSSKIDTCIAIRSEFKNAMWVVANINEKREWYTFDSIRGKNGLTDLKFSLVVYMGDRPEDLALIADSTRVLRPDLIIDCMEQENWHEQDELRNVKLCHDALKPKLGTYVVSRGPLPEHVRQELGADIHLLMVGFDRSKLRPIIDALG